MTAAGSCLAGLLPELRHVLLWMANAVELLYFVQQQGPVYMQGLEQGPDATGRLRGRPRRLGTQVCRLPERPWRWPGAPGACPPRTGTGCLHGCPAAVGGGLGDTGPCARPSAAPERRQEPAEPCGRVQLRACRGAEVLRTRQGWPGGLRGRWPRAAPRGRVGFHGCVSDEDCAGPGPEPSRSAGPSAVGRG